MGQGTRADTPVLIVATLLPSNGFLSPNEQTGTVRSGILTVYQSVN
jgi:hypothetical protein